MASLSSRERVVRALNHQETDRIPIDFGGSSNTLIHKLAHQKLSVHLGLPADGARLQSMMTQQLVPCSGLRERFGSDIILIDPGKPDAWTLDLDPQRGRYVDEWGIEYRMPQDGFYYDWCAHPLKEGNLAELDRYPWPDPRDPGRYRGLEEHVHDLHEHTDKALLVNNPFGIWEHTMALRGMEHALTDLVDNVAFAEELADRLLEWQKVYWDEVLGRIGHWVHVVKINDDLGWQNGPLMSPKTYRHIYKPRHRALVECIRKRTNAKIYIHSDGDIYHFLPDFRDIGIDILNPVEVTARDMGSAKLKAEYGNDFVFWGGGCGNVILTQGTPAEVEAEVRERIQDLATGGGFVFASIHCIQPNMPPENTIALFDSALKWGTYPLR